MSIILHTTGVFADATINGGNLEIPLTSFVYQGGSLSANDATGDYRALIRAVHESYHYFMTGVATGDSNVHGFNKPSYFGEDVGDWQVYQSSYLKRTYSTDLYYNIMPDNTLVDED